MIEFYVHETGETYAFRTTQMANVMRRVIKKFGYHFTEIHHEDH